jgi:hypothetical protein
MPLKQAARTVASPGVEHDVCAVKWVIARNPLGFSACPPNPMRLSRTSAIDCLHPSLSHHT